MKNRFPGTVRPLVALIATSIFGAAAYADNYVGTSAFQGGTAYVGVSSGQPALMNNTANTQIYSNANSGIYLLNSNRTYYDLVNPTVDINADSPGVTMAVTSQATSINSTITNISGILRTDSIQAMGAGSGPALFTGDWDFSYANITGLGGGSFDPAISGALGAVTTLNAGSTYNVDLTTGAAALGAVSSAGITNTGNMATTTLSTTGLATLNSAVITNNASVGGTLTVTGATTTNGITNTGNIATTTLNTTGLATLNSAVITNNATVGGTLAVTGATTLNGATTVNNSLNVNGATTMVGATNINTTGTAATAIGNAAAAATVVGNVVTATAGNSGLALQNGEARVTVTNSLGNTHGLVVGESSTTLSGGTRSTNLTLNDSGATFSNAATGAPTRVTGVANGAGDFDAVNVRQFSSAVAGVAASANIPGVDTNKTASMGVALGSYMNSQAVAFGGSYRFSSNGVLRASLAAGLNAGGSKTSAGVGAGWSW